MFYHLQERQQKMWPNDNPHASSPNMLSKCQNGDTEDCKCNYWVRCLKPLDMKWPALIFLIVKVLADLLTGLLFNETLVALTAGISGYAWGQIFLL